MKKRQIWRKVTACILAALMLTLTLTACGEASSLVTEENEETGGLEVTAEKAYGTGNSGVLTIADGQCLVISPMLKSGHIAVQLTPVDDFNQAMNDNPVGTLAGEKGSTAEQETEEEADDAAEAAETAEPVLEAKIEGSVMSAYSLAPGEYYVFISTEEEKTTGTVSIMPYDIEELRAQDAALADTLKELPGEMETTLPSDNLEEPADDSTAGTTAAAADSADASEQDAAAPAEADSASTEAAATEEDGQNPVMNFIGPYAWDRASAMVEAAGSNGARISIDWASSAAEGSRWVMTGELDTETLTVKYTDCVKTDYVFGEDGEIESETVQYENGTGTITFHDDGPLTFTWQDDMENIAGDAVFEWNF